MARAEAHLVAEAAHIAPTELRVLGRRVLDIVAPQIGEQHEAEQLADEERDARRETSLVTTRLGDGTTRITLQVPDGVATRLHTYLEAFTSPRHEGTGEADRIPTDRKRGQAFCSLMEAVDPQRLPAHGGGATTLIVTVTLDAMRQDLGTGQLGPSDKLTAAEIRRLACTARVLPAVLGGKSEALDLGRCSIPAAWCEAHHWGDPWAAGGRTDLKDGVLLCPGITIERTTRPTPPPGCPTGMCVWARGRDGQRPDRCGGPTGTRPLFPVRAHRRVQPIGRQACLPRRPAGWRLTHDRSPPARRRHRAGY